MIYKIIKYVCAALACVAPAALYFLSLWEKLPKGTYAYNVQGFVWLLCPVSLAAFLIAAKSKVKITDEPEIWEDNYEEDFEDSYSEQIVGDGVIEEYSELYREREISEVPVYTAPDIAAAIAAQKASFEENEDAEDDEFWNSFFKRDEDSSSDGKTKSIYDDLPETLPEGFTFEEETEEEVPEDIIEEQEDKKKSFVPLRIAFAAVCACCVIGGYAMGGFSTAVGSYGVYRNGKIYNWSDIEKINVYMPLLNSGRINLIATLDSGESVDILTGSAFKTEKGSSMGELGLCAHICKDAKNAGVSKTVQERHQIEEAFSQSESSQLIYDILN